MNESLSQLVEGGCVGIAAALILGVVIIRQVTRERSGKSPSEHDTSSSARRDFRKIRRTLTVSALAVFGIMYVSLAGLRFISGKAGSVSRGTAGRKYPRTTWMVELNNHEYEVSRSVYPAVSNGCEITKYPLVPWTSVDGRRIYHLDDLWNMGFWFCFVAGLWSIFNMYTIKRERIE